jgi:hypothetical protein
LADINKCGGEQSRSTQPTLAQLSVINYQLMGGVQSIRNDGALSKPSKAVQS